MFKHDLVAPHKTLDEISHTQILPKEARVPVVGRLPIAGLYGLVRTGAAASIECAQ